jgi:hypothetical protein
MTLDDGDYELVLGLDQGCSEDPTQVVEELTEAPNQSSEASDTPAPNPTQEGKLKRPPIREDLKVMLYQSQKADNTFITSDGTSPYNSTR